LVELTESDIANSLRVESPWAGLLGTTARLSRCKIEADRSRLKILGFSSSPDA
jgi:hypothetical protein